MTLSSPKSFINPYFPSMCFTNKYKHTKSIPIQLPLEKASSKKPAHTLIPHQVLLSWLTGISCGERARGKQRKRREDEYGKRWRYSWQMHRETEIWQTGEWMCRKREMILSKWCFISVINPASQEDEEGLSLSPATIVQNKGALMGPIRAKYQISSLRMILPSRSRGLLNLWPQSHTLHAVHTSW